MCTNDVGTGKTITYLNAIVLAVKRLQVRRRRGVKETESAPTLIIVPAQLLPQTFSEAQANFPELNFHSFFGSRNGIPTTNPRHAATRTTKELDELMCTWASARDDPNTATNVVFTSYSTMYRRWFRPFPVRFDPTRDWAPWVFDRLVKFTEDPSGQGSAGPDTQMAYSDYWGRFADKYPK